MIDYSQWLSGKKALSRKQVNDLNFPFTEYKHEFGEGEYTGTLVMKEWGKAPCIHCYFLTDTGDKLLLIAFDNNNVYKPSDNNIDFGDINTTIGLEYKLLVGRSKNNRTKWLKADLI